MENTLENVSFLDFDFLIAAAMIILCPITWNIVARIEFHTKFLSKLVGNNRLAADIFAHVLIEMGIFRNFMYSRALKSDFSFSFGNVDSLLIALGWMLVITGGVLVFMCYYRLGIHGIYYADYFGVLMNEKVTKFPYNVMNNPLYIGSEMIFLGMAMKEMSIRGLLLTVLAVVMYKFASILENPMTELIYSPENIAMIKAQEKEKKIEKTT